MCKNTWRTVAVSLLLIVAMLSVVGAAGKERVGWLVADQVTVLEGGMTLNSAMSLQDGLTVGTDGTSYDVTFYSDTAGDWFLWDQDQEALTIIGTNAQDALNIDDGNVDIDDDLDVNGTTNLDDLDVDLTASLNIDGHMVDIGTGSCSVADGDNDLCVAGDVEIDNELELDGALDADSTADIADTLTLSKASGNALVVSAGGGFDMNGNIDLDGSADEAQLAVTGYTTQTSDLVQFDGGLTDIGAGTYTTANGDNDLGIDGDLEVNGAADLDGTLDVAGVATFGTDGTAADVVFYSDTGGDYMRWDQSAEALVITGTAAANALNVADGNVYVADNVTINGTGHITGALDLETTLLAEAGGDFRTYIYNDGANYGGALGINDSLTVTGQTTFGMDGTAADVVWYSDTAGDYMRWDQSAEALVITGTNAAVALNVTDGNVDIDDQLNVNGAVDLDSTLAVAGKVSAEGDLEVDDWFVLDVGAATISITGTEGLTTATGTYMLVACTLGGGCTPASPAIADGTEVGQILILQITGSNDITLTDDANLQLGGATRVLTAAKGDLIMLMWNGTDWFELSFTDIN